MRLIGLVGVLACSFTLAVLAADAQPADKARLPVVGVLVADDRYLREFSRALADLGWTEGETVRLEVRSGGGRHAPLSDLAAELVRLKVDVIATLAATPPALAAKRATTTIPIVFGTGGDPVEFGIVSNVVRPERNLTGLGGTASVNQKRLQLLREAAPRARRVAILANVENPIYERMTKAAEPAARQLGLELHEVRVRETVDALASAFSTMRQQRVDAFVVQGDTFFHEQRSYITGLAARARLPGIYPSRPFADAGGLMSFAVDYVALSRRVAGHVDRILRGAKPGDLPVEEVTKFEFVINRKTAKALGLTIPQTLLLQADQVIE